MEIIEAIKAVRTLMRWIDEHPDYIEFENDLYSLSNALEEEQANESK